MMRWERATRERFCGRCGARIDQGAPLLLLNISSLRSGPKVRGECCAGPAPPDLPTRVELRAPPPLSMTQLGMLSLDWKQRAGGREPGEEG